MPEDRDDAERIELREALSRPLPEIPCRYFYDERGCALFERITELPEYYPTRTEARLLAELGDEILEAAQPQELAELGAGSARKIALLVDAARRAGRGLLRVVLLDLHGPSLEEAAARLRRQFDGIDVRICVADFLKDIRNLGRVGDRRLVLFLAGTIGNLHPDDVPDFFRSVADLCGPDDTFLLGIDLVKDRARLEAAYDDAAGVTAEFNLNALDHVVRRWGGSARRADFEHRAFWDAEHAWIEMRLRARRSTVLSLPRLNVELLLPVGAEIRTELSCKYTRESIERKSRGTGLRLDRFWTDAESLFGLALFRPAAGA
jgi:L-histidine N-alpha-methyltransferase